MTFTLPPEDFRALATPILERAAGQIAEQLARCSEQLARDASEGYMDKAAAAIYLGQSVRTIENWMRSANEGGRGLPYFKIGETVLFKRARIDAWALNLERNAPIAVLEDAA